jgi:dTDP-glucose 4,6-dehydratase
MNILITGGAGFIGSNFIELVLKTYSNIHIFNIDKLGVGSRTLFDNCNIFN